jgi:hypothetical protein
MSRPEEEYHEFVGSRAASLHRTAYLLCGDWHLANDLVQETFVLTFRHWRRVQRADNQNAYVFRNGPGRRRAPGQHGPGQRAPGQHRAVGLADRIH